MSVTQDTLFRTLLVAASAMGVAARIYWQMRAEREGGAVGPARDHVGFVIGAIASAPLILVPFLGYVINPGWMGWARMSLPDLLRWIGAAVLAAGMPALLWVFATLGRNLTRTTGVRERATLVTTGPYRFVRHPLYAVAAMMWLGTCLMTASWLMALGVVVLLAVLPLRIDREEANLVARFGDEYRRYADCTGRLAPRLRRASGAPR